MVEFRSPQVITVLPPLRITQATVQPRALTPGRLTMEGSFRSFTISAALLRVELDHAAQGIRNLRDTLWTLFGPVARFARRTGRPVFHRGKPNRLFWKVQKMATRRRLQGEVSHAD